jgi:hypothetical protein
VQNILVGQDLASNSEDDPHRIASSLNGQLRKLPAQIPDRSSSGDKAQVSSGFFAGERLGLFSAGFQFRGIGHMGFPMKRPIPR